MSDERKAELLKQWHNANARVNRWITRDGSLATLICRVEDDRMQRIEKELGYKPNTPTAP